MTTSRPDDTATALRDLDPAPVTALTEAERARAEATFARILASPDLGHAAERLDRSRRRRTARLLVPVGLVAAAAAGSALLVGGGSALASWTPTPEPLTGVDAAEAAATCLAVLGQSDRGERPVLAERRGEWTYVILVGPGSEGSCLMPGGLVGQPDPTAQRTEGFMGSFTSDPVEWSAPARGALITTSAGSGTVPVDGLWGFSEDEEYVTFVAGEVGRDVVAVTVQTPTGTDVEASVANGRFAAWWPSYSPSSENPGVDSAWTYTVTLADGSRTDACLSEQLGEPCSTLR